MTTFLDMARRFIPDQPDSVLEFVLWNHTAYPLAGVLTVARQLIRFKKLADLKLSECCFCAAPFQAADGMVHLGGDCRTEKVKCP